MKLLGVDAVDASRLFGIIEDSRRAAIMRIDSEPVAIVEPEPQTTEPELEKTEL